MTEASNAKIMDAFAQARDEALADLAAVQVQARMDLQAMKAERDAALHLECAVAGMLRETEVALAVVTAERDALKASLDECKQLWREHSAAEYIATRSALKAECDAALALRQERDKWKQMAEWQYALRRYPHDLEMGNGALDAHMKSWTWDAAIDATRKGKT